MQCDSRNAPGYESMFQMECGFQQSGLPGRQEVPIWIKPVLTIREAATVFGIGEQTIREMIRDENQPTDFSFTVGNKVLISRELFDEYIKRLCKGEI